MNKTMTGRRIRSAAVDYSVTRQAQGDRHVVTPPQGPGAMEDPTSAAVRFRDYCNNVNPELDLSFLTAFRQADKPFTADNEPQAIRDWVDDMSFMHHDLRRWVQVAVDYQTSPSTSQTDLDAAAETVRQDLVTAEADASAVQRG